MYIYIYIYICIYASVQTADLLFIMIIIIIIIIIVIVIIIIIISITTIIIIIITIIIIIIISIICARVALLGTRYLSNTATFTFRDTLSSCAHNKSGTTCLTLLVKYGLVCLMCCSSRRRPS